MAGVGERTPGEVEPAIAGEQLVGVGARLEVVHQSPELGWILRADIGCLTDEVLRVFHPSHPGVHSLTSEARIDDHGTHYEPRRLQQLMTAISQISHHLHLGDILGVFTQVEKLAQLKMLR